MDAVQERGEDEGLIRKWEGGQILPFAVNTTLGRVFKLGAGRGKQGVWTQSKSGERMKGL